MLYEGQRRTVPSSKYGALLDLMERYGGTIEEWGEAPDELVQEALIRLQIEAKVRNAERKRMEARAKSKSRR